MSTQTRLTGFPKAVAIVVAIGSILMLWQFAAWTLPDFLMPGVPTVFDRLLEELRSASFLAALSGSMTRLGLGYGAALLFGGARPGDVRAGGPEDAAIAAVLEVEGIGRDAHESLVRRWFNCKRLLG